MTYLDPVNDGGKKLKPQKPVKQLKPKKEPVESKPVMVSRRTIGIVIGVVVVVVIAAVVAVLLTLSSTSTNQSKAKQAAAAQDKKTAQATLVSDVKKTTANIKAYLQKNPKASIDQMISNSKTVNTLIDKGETVLIANGASSPAKAYTNWIVVATDTKTLGKDLNYQYQSYSNTFRWQNNKTGASSNIVEDTTPRNAGALGGN